MPWTVRSAPWLVGLLNADRNVTAGASYENVCVEIVPTTELTRRMPVSFVWEPTGAAQRTCVVLVHVVVAQMVEPTWKLGVKSFMPKLVPCRETVAPPEAGEFSGCACVTVGASKLKTAARVPMWPFSAAATL